MIQKLDDQTETLTWRVNLFGLQKDVQNLKDHKVDCLLLIIRSS